MRAAVLFGPNDLRVTEVDRPSPAPDEVLIKVEACAICGSDLSILGRPWEYHPPFGGYIPGHEFSGTVVELGAAVDEFRIGDRVALHVHKGCGRCANCMSGLYTACLNYGNTAKGHRAYGITANGGFAQYAAVHVSNLFRLPDSLSTEEACIVTNAACGLYGLETTGSHITGETVAVIGPGPIGLMVVQMCKAYAAKSVILAGTRKERLDLGAELGADVTVRVNDVTFTDYVLQATEGQGVDLSVDCSGAASAAADALSIVRRGGKVLLLSNYREPTMLECGGIVSKNITVFGARAEGGRAVGRALELMAQGRISGKKLITHRFPLDGIAEGFDVFANRRDGAIKVIIHPWE